VAHKTDGIKCYTSIPLRDAIWSFHAKLSVGESFFCKKKQFQSVIMHTPRNRLICIKIHDYSYPFILFNCLIFLE